MRNNKVNEIKRYEIGKKKNYNFIILEAPVIYSTSWWGCIEW